MDLIYTQKPKARDCSDHVDQSIERPDFVQVDLGGADSMDLGLSSSQAFEDADRLFLNGSVQTALGDSSSKLFEVMVMMMMMRVGFT